MGEIILHGDCLVNRSTEIQQVLLHHLSEGDDQTDVDLSGTGRCDLSFFQLICAATRSFAAKGKILELASPLPETIVKQLKQIGFAAACTACVEAQCLLKTETLPTTQETGGAK